MSSLPHGGDAFGSAPSNPLLVPALSGARDLSMSRQQALLDLQAIQRIPGLAGYWPANPAYLFEDSVGYIPATVDGVVGRVLDISTGAQASGANLFPSPEDFTTAYWWLSACTAEVSTEIAPDGVAATKIVESTETSLHFIRNIQVMAKVGMLYTAYIDVKPNGREKVYVEFSAGAYGSSIVYNIQTGQVDTAASGGAVGDITALGNGWFRCGITNISTLLTTINFSTYFYSGSASSYQGDGVSGLYIRRAHIRQLGLVGSHAIQATTANKPYLRRTPTSGVYWLDSDAAASEIVATLGNLGSACTVARAGAEGVTFTEGVSISSTYNLAPYNASELIRYCADVAIFNRDLTVTEKALLTRYMRRRAPLVYNGSIA